MGVLWAVVVIVLGVTFVVVGGTGNAANLFGVVTGHQADIPTKQTAPNAQGALVSATNLPAASGPGGLVAGVTAPHVVTA